MQMLEALGVNATVLYQFGFFLITYIVLSNVLFKPYYKAFLTRGEKTVGNTESAEKMLAEARDLEAEYELKAREINTKVRGIYEQSRQQAMREQEKQMAEARLRAKQIIEDNKQKVQTEVARAQQEISKEVTSVSQAMATKLLGKDLTA